MDLNKEVSDGESGSGSGTGEVADNYINNNDGMNLETIFSIHKEKLFQIYIQERKMQGFGLLIMDATTDQAKVHYRPINILPEDIRLDIIDRWENNKRKKSFGYFLIIGKTAQKLVEYDFE